VIGERAIQIMNANPRSVRRGFDHLLWKEGILLRRSKLVFIGENEDLDPSSSPGDDAILPVAPKRSTAIVGPMGALPRMH
jgi:hypothetical protein